MIKGSEATDDETMHDAETLRRRIVWDALQGALSMLGESSMKAVMHHLTKRGININNINLKELEHVLHSLFGDGANVVINEMCKRLEREYLGLDMAKDAVSMMRERMIKR